MDISNMWLSLQIPTPLINQSTTIITSTVTIKLTAGSTNDSAATISSAATTTIRETNWISYQHYISLFYLISKSQWWYHTENIYLSAGKCVVHFCNFNFNQFNPLVHNSCGQVFLEFIADSRRIRSAKTSTLGQKQQG